MMVKVLIASNCIATMRRHSLLTKRLLATDNPKPWTEMPGLTSYPVVGSLHNFLPYIGSIGPISTTYDMLDKVYKRYGPIVRLGRFFSRNPMMVLFEPDHIEQVFRNENIAPRRDGFKTMDYFRRELNKDIFGDGVSGLVSAQGAEWKAFRTKVNPLMLLPNTIKLYRDTISLVAEEMIERLDRLRKDPEYLVDNLDVEMTRWALESISVVALGQPIGCLKDNLPQDHPSRQLQRSVRDILFLTFSIEMGPPIWKYYESKAFKKLMRAYEVNLSVSKKYVYEAMDKIKNRTVPIADEDKGILEKLLDVDEKVAIVIAIDMMAAGVDSVSNQMISILHLLARNQDKQKKLRAEIRANNPAYTRAVIREAMRLTAVVGSNLRGTTKEHVVGGYLIPKGVDIIFPHEYLVRQDRYYPRAREFIPERYLVGKSDPLYYGQAHPMVSLPFGFGARSCIGRRIAELEMESFITKFFDRFEVHWYGTPVRYVSKSVNMYLKPFTIVISDAPK